MSSFEDPMTQLSKEHGCSLCGAKGSVFYWIEYYILPSRLVRKRHRDKARCAIFCRACYEKTSEFVFAVNGTQLSVSKKGSKNFGDAQCVVCAHRMMDTAGSLYGVVASVLLTDAALSESRPIAYLCAECLEERDVCLEMRVHKQQQ